VLDERNADRPIMTICPQCHESIFVRSTVKPPTETAPPQWHHTCKRCATEWDGEPGTEPINVSLATRHLVKAVQAD